MSKRKSTDYIAIHCSATAEQDFGAKDVDVWHRMQGYKSIGYHYVIKRDGTVETGRYIDDIGAHVYGFNAVSVGICLIGGVSANDSKKAVNNYTQAQFASLKTLIESLKEKYPNAQIQGHRDFPNVKKECPCFDVKDWLKTVGLS